MGKNPPEKEWNDIGQPPEQKKPADASAGKKPGQIAQPWGRQASQTVTAVFPPFPPAARARAADSADLPPLCSQPAGSRSFIASATSIVCIYHITSFRPFQGGILLFCKMGGKCVCPDLLRPVPVLYPDCSQKDAKMIHTSAKIRAARRELFSAAVRLYKREIGRPEDIRNSYKNEEDT